MLKISTALFFSITILFFTYSCSSSKLLEQGSIEPQEFYTQMKFDTMKSIIVLDVDIDGEHKNFLFDTGADFTLVQRDSLVGKTTKISGASKRKMEFAHETIASLKIVDVTFRNTYALSGDMVGLKEQIPNFGGILGQPIIQKANWLIDYPKKELTISNKNLIDDSFQPIEVKRGALKSSYTFIEIDGIKYKVVIDLGSSSEINLPKDSKFAKHVAKTIQLSKNNRKRYTLGGLQNITEDVGFIPKIKLGDFEFNNVHVSINTSSQPRVGMRFFRDYLVYIDNANGGVYKLKKSQ